MWDASAIRGCDKKIGRWRLSKALLNPDWDNWDNWDNWDKWDNWDNWDNYDIDINRKKDPLLYLNLSKSI